MKTWTSIRIGWAAVGLIGAILPRAGAAPAPEALSEIAEAVRPSIVLVEHSVRFDRGELPRASVWQERCPVCGESHSQTFAEYIAEERPLAVTGFLLTPTQVVTEDPQTHERFVEKIEVRQDGQRVPARIAAFLKHENAIIVELERPLKGAQPLEFASSAATPSHFVTYTAGNGGWNLGVAPFGFTLIVPENQPAFYSTPALGLVTDATGAAIGAAFTQELPASGAWKGSPLDAPSVTAAEMEDAKQRIRKRSDAMTVRVTLRFRSPDGRPGFRRFRREAENAAEVETERQASGVALEGGRILVLADLEPKTTARLESMTAHTADGESIDVRFEASLKDYGCLVGALERPLPAVAEWATAPIEELKNELILLSDVALLGEQRLNHVQPIRIAGFDEGWRGRIQPIVPNAGEGSFLFDLEGRLIALPAVERGGRFYTSMPRQQTRRVSLIPARRLASLLEDLPAASDPANVPLNERDENRLAWMGVELQPLSRELARINQVSDETLDGANGALVSHVYPNSPAAEAGIQPGDILLRLRFPDEAWPIEVRLDEDRGYQQAFPWERLDQVPDQMFDQIPSPWPPVENSVARALTDLGFGARYRVEFFNGEEVIEKEFEVTPGPPHFESAPELRDEELGLTVRNLTYEVRRYLQRGPEEPGVVVAKVETGSRASVAGIKPYEVITHVNGLPIADVEAFEQATKGRSELNLFVKRMASGRLVSLRKD